jgi:hypothetical protein
VNSADLAADLRARADALEQIATLEKKAADAKQRYRENPDDTRAHKAHRAASQKLAEARTALRREAEDGGYAPVGGDAVASSNERGKA